MKNTLIKVPRIRLLPSVMMCAAALLALKLVGLATGLETVLGGVQPAFAETPAEEDTGGEAAAAEASDPVAESGDGEAGAGEAASAEEQMSPEMGVPAAAAASPFSQFELPSAAERDVLRSLAARRKELDERERELQMQQRLLEASERRVQIRIDELKEIEGRIENLFGVQEEAQEKQLASLVTMYQNMKPKDAARILGQLDMDVLIQVVRRMSERKMAPILAAMDPVAAQELTVELATGGSMPEGFDMSAVLEEAPPAP